jgi:signal transduction histidine kinase
MALQDLSVAHDHQHLVFLRELAHAFGSATSLEEATSTLVSWARAATGDRASTVAVYMPDARRRLHLVSVEGRSDRAPDRLKAARITLDGMSTIRWRLAGAAREEAVFLPLTADGESFGILEVIAPADSVEESLILLEPVASQGGAVMRSLGEKRSLEAKLRLADGLPRLAATLMRSKTAGEAILATLDFCHEHAKRPAAAWVVIEPGPRLTLSNTRGLSGNRAEVLRTKLPALTRSAGSPSPWEEASVEFSRAARSEGVTVVDAGDAVILCADAALASSADMVAELLQARLHSLKTEGRHDRMRERLDFGIALTAHELRGPLLGSLAVLQIIEGGDERQQRLLTAAKTQLLHMSQLAESLLRWNVAGQQLDKEPTDLGELVREAIMLRLPENESKIGLEAEDGIFVEADPVHLRNAIAYVLGHATWHSPGDGNVQVTVAQEPGMATVTIEDNGPPLPASERELLFHPLTRSPELPRSRRALALYAARGELEAHGGGISVSSNKSGVTFRIELPLDGDRRQSSEL